MYARYIPPPKGSEAVSSPKPSPRAPVAPTRAHTSPPNPTVAPAPADGYGYARYIPGTQAAKKPTVHYFDNASSPSQPKRKREAPDEPRDAGAEGTKKAKTRGEQHDVTVVSAKKDKEEPKKLQSELKKKKNRRKRKQRTRADSDSDSSGSEDETPKRAAAETERHAKSEPLTETEKNDTPCKAKRKERTKEKPVDKPTEEPQSVTKAKRKGGVEKENPMEKPTEEPQSAKKTKRKERAEKGNLVDKPPEEAQSDKLANGDVEMTGVEDFTQEPQVSAERKKKRDKEKKKKSDKEVSASEPQQQEEKVPRHKTVLERKENSMKLASKAAQEAGPEPEEEPTELHDLEPLPQPAVVADDDSKPAYHTLPPWLANPLRVSQETRQPFAELGIQPKPARFLAQKGFAEAFAVQTAAIPLLLPSNKHRPGDVLVSAVTGSGKTLAYALPIVRDLGQGLVTRLRALVVLPTRELVKQAQEVFEICARAYDCEERKKVRIGVAVGHQSIKAEQHSLMASESRYDPEAYEVLKEQDAQQARQTAGDDPRELDADGVKRKSPWLGAWEGEVVDWYSKVDVLICTPGRLVEHVEQTPGFSLDYVRWLVVDEADKLLAQSFQGWLDLVMERFKVNKYGARDFADMEYSGVRKVVLSATLTRDLSLLGQLDLRRPRLIVLETDGAAQVAEHTLPHSLREFAVRVHETSLKPLYLLDLLRSPDMAAVLAGGEPAASRQQEASESDPDSGSDSDSDSTSDSDSGSDSDSSDASSDSSETASASGSSLASDSQPPQSPLPQSLIFTKSNEAALRLARLLELLDPTLSTRISTLTSNTPTHVRRKTLRAFATASSPVRLVVASDLVARGIDIPRLGHVVNYDLPPSVAGYVHRVGRTARAGRPGCAWTLLGDEESGWFWGKIAKGQGVRRAQKVERTRIEEMGEERTRQYEEALAQLGKEALEMKRG